MQTTAALIAALSLLVGLVAGWLAGRRTQSAQVLAALHAAGTSLRDQQVQAAEDLQDRHHAVQSLVAPLAASLERVQAQLHELEGARIGAYAQLTEQVRTIAGSSEQLRHETGQLVDALRRPQPGGRWGELQLRRVVELAGMLDRCDFSEQVVLRSGAGGLRPDLLVHLPGGKEVIVDAKVSLAAYLDASASSDPAVRSERMAAHARHLRAHVDALATKSYWSELATSPEFVVLFIPGEAFLAPALQIDPELLEDAARRRVILATPTTLIALLRSVSYGWNQQRLSENAAAVFETGRELYSRLSTLGEHLDRLGRTLGSAVTHFNATVGSLESRVLPSARRLGDLQHLDPPLVSPSPREEAPRPLGAPELLTPRPQPALPEPLVVHPGSAGAPQEDSGDRPAA